MNDSERALREFVERTQDVLWDRLDDDLRTAINGEWSIAAANTVINIISAARLVGATSWESVPARLVAGRVWEAVLALGDVEHEPLTEDDGRRAMEVASRSLEPDAVAGLMYRLSVSIEKMRADSAYILDSLPAAS